MSVYDYDHTYEPQRVEFHQQGRDCKHYLDVDVSRRTCQVVHRIAKENNVDPGRVVTRAIEILESMV
jgi:hypothetical protein